MDTSLWAHRIILGSVSPYLQKLLMEYEKQGDDVITIFLPLIKGYHMKLVLDYIYSGAMYLCGAHMQYVIQVMEVLQLKCGVSVNKMVKASEESQDPAKQWIEIEHSTMHIKEYDSDHDIHKSEDEGEEREMSKTGEEKGEKVSCDSVIKEADTNQKQLEEPKSRSVSSNLESQKERRLSSREGDDD